MRTKIVLYCDGCYRELANRGGWGVYDKHKGKMFGGRCKVSGSLAAEMIAVIRALKYAKNCKRIVILTDCKTLVKAIKEKRMLKNHEELSYNLFALLSERRAKVHWISRNDNKIADKQASLAAMKGYYL